MDFDKALKEYGKEKAFRAIFRSLNGIDFETVEIIDYKSIYQLVDEIEYFSNKWVFTNDHSISLICVSPNEKNTNTLNELRLLNRLKFNQEWYFGEGFKLNQAAINENLSAIRITASDVLMSSIKDESSYTMVNSINLSWIKGINGIINANSVADEDKKLSQYPYIPIWFNDEPEHIIIPIKDPSTADHLVKCIIDLNGGKDAFNKPEISDSSKAHWEVILEGRDFVVGYIPKEKSIRINRFLTNIEGEEKSSSFEIHPLSSKISSVVEGIDEHVYTQNNNNLESPPFFAVDEVASEVIVSSVSNEKVLSKFQKIVLKNAPEDEFLTITPSSVIDWLGSNQNRQISLDVPSKFASTLRYNQKNLELSLRELPKNSKGWDKRISNDRIIPKVIFSEPFKTKRVLSVPIERKISTSNQETAKSKIRNEFLRSNIQDEIPEKVTSVDRGSNFWRWVLIILGIIALFLLLRNCNYSNNPEHYFSKGVTHYESKEYKNAKENFDKVVDEDPNYYEAFWYRSLVQFEQNDFQNALYDVDKAISIDNNNWELYHLRGRIKMNMANSKFSRKYKEALDDFNMSLSLNESTENAKSFYYRGRTHELLEDGQECPDYYKACEYSFEDACTVVDEICYPETGFMPYNRFFGPGVQYGSKKFEIDNRAGSLDAVVSLINIRTGKRIRAQFVRAGQELVISGVPEGSYKIQMYEGNYWSNSMVLPDGISKGGFLENGNFKEVDYTWIFGKETDKRGIILNSSSGDLNSREIDDSEFFN